MPSRYPARLSGVTRRKPNRWPSSSGPESSRRPLMISSMRRCEPGRLNERNPRYRANWTQRPARRALFAHAAGAYQLRRRREAITRERSDAEDFRPQSYARNLQPKPSSDLARYEDGGDFRIRTEAPADVGSLVGTAYKSIII